MAYLATRQNLTMGLLMITIRIKRHTYHIDESDRFMDNGVCVQLLTKSGERSSWGQRIHPVLSKRAVKEIAAFERVYVASSGEAKVFGLRAT